MRRRAPRRRSTSCCARTELANAPARRRAHCEARARTATPRAAIYREIFRSADLVAPADGRGPARGAHDYLLPAAAGIVSRWHRVTSDEVWHLYEGGPLEVLELDLGCRALDIACSERRNAGTGVHGRGRPLAGRASARRTTRWSAAPSGPGFDFEDFTMLCRRCRERRAPARDSIRNSRRSYRRKIAARSPRRIQFLLVAIDVKTPVAVGSNCPPMKPTWRAMLRA